MTTKGFVGLLVGVMVMIVGLATVAHMVQKSKPPVVEQKQKPVIEQPVVRGQKEAMGAVNGPVRPPVTPRYVMPKVNVVNGPVRPIVVASACAGGYSEVTGTNFGACSLQERPTFESPGDGAGDGSAAGSACS